MLQRILPRLAGRVYGWFESRDSVRGPIAPRYFNRARLRLTDLEDRSVPAAFVVTNATDADPGSLRDAINAINLSVDPTNTITFNSTFSTAKTILLASQLPSIAVPLSITGLQSGGVNTVTISGGGTVAIFDTQLAPTDTPILFDKLNLTGGFALADTLNLGGGLTMGDEAVTIRNSTIAACTARVGGAVNMSGIGTLNLRSSTITGNLSTSTISFEGGGAVYMYSAGTLDFQDSTLSNNKSRLGGGVLVYNGGAVNVLNCTVSGNVSSVSRGGGFYIFGDMTALNFRNSTFTGNVAATSGGAIAFQSVGMIPGETINVRNCTITGNTASSASATLGNGGGGIMTNTNSNGPNTLILESCIVSGNTSPGGLNDLSIFAGASPTTLTMTFTAIGTNKGFTHDPPDGVNQNLAYGADLKLDSGLKSNGAAANAPQTIALLGGSPAIDAGSNSTGLTTDQRGGAFAREVPTGEPDIGAFERVAGVPLAIVGSLPTVAVNDATTNPYKFTVTYADDTAINVTTIGTGDVLVTGPGGFSQPAAFVSVDNPANGTPRTATYQITPLGGTWDLTDNGTYTLALQANEVKSTSNIAVPSGTLGTFNVSFTQTFLVTNANDDGAGSLRAAITAANTSNNTPDTILFDTKFFNTSMKTITLVTALPSISDGVVITGPGKNLATVNADQLFRVLDTTAAPGKASVSITGLTLANGKISANGGGLNIGDEAVSLAGMAIDNNFANNGGGIAVASAAATLTIADSRISGNTILVANGDGGGIYIAAAAAVTITTTTISGNSSGSDGGGIYFLSGGSLNMTRSTVSGNSASGAGGTFNSGGGGIYFFGVIGPAGFKISNSTISGNTHTALAGGGICFTNLTGTPEILNCTITNNGSTGDGGGVARTGTGGVNGLILTGTVLSGNSSTFGANHDLSFGLVGEVTATFSAVGVDSGAINDYANPTKNNVPLGAVLNLGVLADNGGPTETHLPAAGPLINSGTNAAASAVDQRGLTRSFGQTDIGSVEVQPAAATVTGFTVNNGAAQRSRLTTITVTFSGPVSSGTFSGLGAITLTRTAATPTGVVGTIVQTGATGANGLITVTQPGPANQLVLTFSNANGANETAGVEYGSLADGRWQLAVASAGFTSTFGDTQLRRLFGDFEAGPGSNGTVDAGDFATFGGAFGTSGAPGFSPFDYDNNGTLDSVDLGAIGARFGFSV